MLSNKADREIKCGRKNLFLNIFFKAHVIQKYLPKHIFGFYLNFLVFQQQQLQCSTCKLEKHSLTTCQIIFWLTACQMIIAVLDHFLSLQLSSEKIA